MNIRSEVQNLKLPKVINCRWNQLNNWSCLASYLVRDPVVAGFNTCSSKYWRTNLTRSSRDGRPNSIISSILSLIAQSNWSGWLLARTSINLHTNTEKWTKTDTNKLWRNESISYSCEFENSKRQNCVLQKFSSSSSKVKKRNFRPYHFVINLLLARRFSGSVEEGVQCTSQVFAHLFLRGQKNILHLVKLHLHPQ